MAQNTTAGGPAETPAEDPAEDRKELGIRLDKICYLIDLAREFDAKVDPVIPDQGSNEVDDGDRRILEDYADDATLEALLEGLRGLGDEETVTVLALVWLGRGDETEDDWDDVLKQAQDIHDQRAPEYLAGIPLLSSHLEEGLSKLGYSCTGMGYLYEA